MEMTKLLRSLIQFHGVKDLSNDSRLRFRSLVIAWENDWNSGPTYEKSTKTKLFFWNKKVTF